MKNIYTAIFILLSFSINGQNLYDFQHVDFMENGEALAFPTAGGLNTPQFSNVDFNNDGNLDLVVFDKVAKIYLPFKHSGASGTLEYTYAPEYAHVFPEVSKFSLIRDYNCDGIGDVFAYNRSPTGLTGIGVWQGSYNGNSIRFDKVLDNIEYPGFMGIPTNLAIQATDVPSIDDIDGDGDLDILTFSFGGGSYLELYKNQSVENGFGCDSLIFELCDACWGRVFESSFNADLTLSADIDSCAGNIFWSGVNCSLNNNRHTGSTVLTLDLDGDSDKDVVIGDISFNYLSVGINGGSTTTAWMTSASQNFPLNSPLDLQLFPAAYHVDVDMDGVRDIMVSPNDEQYAINDSVAWYYRNIQTDDTPEFVLNEKGFLSNEMVDAGTGFSPIFVDYNFDGLLDIVAGNLGNVAKDSTLPISRLLLYENVGTSQLPAFELVDEDYANLKQYDLVSLHPSFGDIDADGDKDMIVGQSDGTVIFIPNNAGPNTTFNFGLPVFDFQNIDVGDFSTPFIIDLDRDARLDVVIGEKNGELNFFRNTGTITTPVYNSNLSGGGIAIPSTSQLGMATADDATTNRGYSTPCFIEKNGQYELFLGTFSGYVKHYTDVDNNIYNSFTLASDRFDNIFSGIFSAPAVVDINNDGDNDIVIGNFRGGLTFYSKNPFFVNTEIVINKTEFKIYPNPVEHTLIVESKHRVEQITIYDALGRLVRLEAENENSFTLDVSNLMSGIYLIELMDENGNVGSEKVIVK